MRIIKEFLKDEIKITLYHWNNRYLIKLEWELFEQTFKIPEWDLTSEADIDEILSADFLNTAANRFREMAGALGQAIQRLP
ncbi:MAG TPA: hypothetical protein PLM56_05090 [Cyclobacteriaceae bacterium]|jgi:hypothetical protein|nr:hypothetical protein [Cytophagales bacterium]HMR56768.1 hypothetical protein [Cyclobacteriaceae bacterium]HNT51260.1 hypothetical protein [Cyclobacteriaceae bacterium]HRE66331.1 hypothetical protein [Cyclobacteriaceae bacterium]HRF32847.1 hypothetical protein [Cyclobacteriaceae bacterium]